MWECIQAQETRAGKLFWSYLYFSDNELSMQGSKYDPDGFSEDGSITDEEYKYQDTLLKAKKNGPVSEEGIFTCAKEALKKAYKSAKPEDIAAMDLFSAAIGFPVSSKSPDIRQEPEKNAPKAVLQAKNEKDGPGIEAAADALPVQ